MESMNKLGAEVTIEQLGERIDEALGLVDSGLGELSGRQLVSTNEVADLLLDVRTTLVPIIKTADIFQAETAVIPVIQ